MYTAFEHSQPIPTSAHVALIVEDHVTVRQALCDRLRMSFGRFDVREAATVYDALRIVEAERVDLVLMDIGLPGTSGVDGARMVLERSPRTSVVMVSIYDDSAHRAAALSAGAKEFVSKRAIRKELIPAIERVLADVH